MIATDTVPDGAPVAVAADELAPLCRLTPVYVDVETFMSSTVSLSSMTLRQYVAASYLTTISIAIGNADEPAVFFTERFPGPPGCNTLTQETINALIYAANDPAYVFVCHNAAFDIRILRFMLGVPTPKNVWCSMEGAMAAWPEWPGGYGLHNLSATRLPKGQRKFTLDIKDLLVLRNRAKRRPVPRRDVSPQTLLGFTEIAKSGGVTIGNEITFDLCGQILALYNNRDVSAMRLIYQQQIPRIPGLEQEVALRTHQQRKHHFMVDPERLTQLVEALDKSAEYAETQAGEYLTDDEIANVFNRAGQKGTLGSVRHARLKNIVNERLSSEEFKSVSLKKISPLQLQRNPDVAAVLAQTSRASKMLSHKRRSAIFKGVPEVDCELGYARAHTLRFSSPSVGRGLNLHNCPKHDKAVAEPIRKIFRLPDHLCFVRADLANVEYRVEGLLTNCDTVRRMFDPAVGGDYFSDPYCLGWKAMTGVTIDKKSPVRQVSKSATLGLGFAMSPTGYAKVLMGVTADKTSKVTEASLRVIIIESGWKMPHGDGVSKITDELGCSQIIALASFHIHRLFNAAHPEFIRTADWLVRTIQAISTAGGGRVGADRAKRYIDMAYANSSAPDRDMIGLEIDDEIDPNGVASSVRVRCGPWPRTVCWREPFMRYSENFDRGAKPRLTIRKASGELKAFTRQLAIENLTQAAARNGMCMGVAMLDKKGFPDCIHVHDEALLIVPKNRGAVLAARQAIIDVFGPGGPLPFKWSVLVKPADITVTQSMYESEEDVQVPSLDKTTGLLGPGNDRWGKLMRGEPTMFVDLP